MRTIQRLRSLRRAFTLIELMVVVMIIGVLSATAIPAFKKYLVKSKTTEAFISVRKIFDGECTYYTEERVNSSGGILPKYFLTQTSTPALANIGVNKTVGNWEAGNWGLIRFGADSPVQYSYSVDTSGVDSTASFTARAQGDLDGDGIFSLFERTAVVNSGGSPEGSAGLYIDDELE